MTQQPEAPRYLTLKEAADLARTPAATIRKWIWQGKLQGFKPGRLVLVREADLIALIEGSETSLRNAIAARASFAAEIDREGGALRGNPLSGCVGRERGQDHNDATPRREGSQDCDDPRCHRG
jgi:excisionase family DNA binding protein